QHAPLTGAGRGNTQAASAIQWVSSEAMDDMPSGIRMRSADAHTFKPDIHLETHFHSTETHPPFGQPLLEHRI
ncbi:hypothetical protein, partial [Xanthomonas campestris]|uniref:hypothetical protein n=1 Tax=Xanthomonas campestris TaxID=339 RepID=UPI0035589D65